MKLLLIPLGVLIMCMLMSILVSASEFNSEATGSYFYNETSGQFTVNETDTQTFQMQQTTYSYGINETQGVLAVMIALIVIASIAGFRVLGSGLSDVSVMIIYKTIVLYGIWAIFSVFGFTILNSIPYFGWVMYFILTLMYSFGIIKQVGGGGGTP